VNKSDLIESVADKLGSRATAIEVVDLILESIQDTVATGERMVLSGFGVFELQSRAARVGRNPATGAAVRIPARSVVKFRPGSDFKALTTGDPSMAVAKKAPVKKAVAKKAPVKKAVAKKAPVKKAVAKKVPVKKAVAKKAPVKKVVAKKAPVKKAVATKAPVKKVVAKKAPVKKVVAKKAPVKKVVAKK
jgi:DNA-binding protein HU-beta